MPEFVIRVIRTAHCKRGPQRCEKCREMDYDRICLLDIDPPDQGMMQRRVIEFKGDDGQSVWREFEVVKVFQDKDEALVFARKNEIINLSW